MNSSSLRFRAAVTEWANAACDEDTFWDLSAGGTGRRSELEELFAVTAVEDFSATSKSGNGAGQGETRIMK
jgi:hypothetical protein